MSILTKQPAVADRADFVVSQGRGTGSYDLAELLLRLSAGGLMTGHGMQKLFGWFGGPGLKKTAESMKRMGLEEQPWGTLAALSEFGGGALTSLGLLHPLGPIATLGSLGTAIYKVHWGKPIWAAQGGAELPALYVAIAAALSLGGAGRFSLDRLFGIRVPRFIALLAFIGVLASIVYVAHKEPVPPEQQEDA